MLGLEGRGDCALGWLVGWLALNFALKESTADVKRETVYDDDGRL